MIRTFLPFLLIGSLCLSLFPQNTQAVEFNPHFLVSDAEMTDVFAMTKSDVQAFLQEKGTLGLYVGEDVHGRLLPAADIIWNAAMEFDINPQFLLVLLQREQSLVAAAAPSQNQFDWAMGYAVCDDCSKDDPAIQKYKGFGNQIYYSAKRIRESYLNDLETGGRTLTGVGPRIPKIIDGVLVTPANFATSVLYTYTPHLHGNQNFVAIWHRWFVRDYPTGTLLQDTTNGGVFLIQYGKKRPITSRTALYTRYNPDRIITVQPTVLESYPAGSPISFANYALLRSPQGTVYLLVDDTIRGIDSMETFRGIGFNTDEIIDVTHEDLDPYVRGPIISLETVFPQGTLLQDSSTGGVWFVENGKKSAIHSREILDERFPSWPINRESPEHLAGYEQGEPALFPDGTLVAAHASPDVFVISDGERRWIRDEETFTEYGWDFDHVVWTSERAVLLHPLGADLTLDLINEIDFEESETLEIATE